MDISFIRHGQSAYESQPTINGHDVHSWIKGYDKNGVIEEETFPQESLDAIRKAELIVTSDLPRSMESAALLHPGGLYSSFTMFREAELPIPTWRFLKMKPSIWAVMLRLLWFAGYSPKCESYKAATARAKIAADTLIQYAKNSGSVVLIGHGFFNSFVAKELKRRGWEGKKRTSSKHWGCTTYSYPASLTSASSNTASTKSLKERNLNG